MCWKNCHAAVPAIIAISIYKESASSQIALKYTVYVFVAVEKPLNVTYIIYNAIKRIIINIILNNAIIIISIMNS